MSATKKLLASIDAYAREYERGPDKDVAELLKDVREQIRIVQSKAWVQGAQSFADAFWDGQPGEIENPYEQKGWKPE